MNKLSRDLTKYRVLGIMSGTSLDGLDMALCRFEKNDHSWDFEIEKARTIAYNQSWREKLNKSVKLKPDSLEQLDEEYGQYTGKCILDFISDSDKPDIIASHGHTVFHKPEKGITRQIGNGEVIAELTKTTTIYDFRSEDVRLGGQGAPLVPVGDRDLFHQYDACLNLGGFSNISVKRPHKIIAFDICPVNIILNHFAKMEGLDFDKNGNIGRKGNINETMVKQLNLIEYYQSFGPGSLSREWLQTEFLPVIEEYTINNKDILRSLYEHISDKIAAVLNHFETGSVLLSGGGTFNSLIIELIKSKTDTKLIIPEKKLINFKESLIFAYLGLLRFLEENNCLASVTGASRDNMGGIIINT